ncbi:MAG: hypothetical protein ABF294_07025 [Flavobacteriales bacterium]|jgi:hypothetical protein
MKLFTLSLSIFLISFSSLSQDETKIKEVGLNFYNFDNYGLFYKVGSETKLWRFRVLSGGIGINNINGSFPRTNFNGQLNLSIGRERRREFAPNLDFVSGVELLTNFSYFESNGSNPSSSFQLGAGIGGVFGLRYEINETFFAGAEILPSIMYSSRNGSNISAFDINFQFNTRALLSFGIKF